MKVGWMESYLFDYSVSQEFGFLAVIPEIKQQMYF